MNNEKIITLQAGETVTLKATNGNVINEIKKSKRNTAKEREWEREKYHRFTFLIDKNEAQKFIELLGDVRPLDWVREQIKTFIQIHDDTLNHTLNVIDEKIDNTLNHTLNVSEKKTITPETVAKWHELNVNGMGFGTIAKSEHGLGYERTTIFKRVNELRKQSPDNITAIMQKLQNFKTREEATVYFDESSFNSDMLKTLAKQYSVPNYTRLNKHDLIEKIIETTVGAKLRFDAIYNTKVR